MTLAHIVLPGMVARVDVRSERFAAVLAQLFELTSASHADIRYDVAEEEAQLVVRRGDRVLFTGTDPDLALIALYGDLYELFVGSAGMLLLHAGAAVKDGRAVVLPGSQESGKSTLTTLLAGRGWEVISDDIGAVDAERLTIAPYPRRLLIRPHTLERNRRARDGVRLLRELDAYGELVHVAEPRRRARQAARIALLAFPRWALDGVTTIVPLSRGEAVASLMDNSVNLRFLGLRGVRSAAEVSRGARAYRLATGDPEEALDALERLHAA